MENIKSINVEAGLYSCDEALALVEREIEVLSLDKQVRVLKVIHGYGSSGSGGAIKNNLPNLLSKLVKLGKIEDFIQNNKFGALSVKYKKYTKLYPNLLLDGDLNNLNPGITLVFLK